jgi:hypothetical protein
MILFPGMILLLHDEVAPVVQGDIVLILIQKGPSVNNPFSLDPADDLGYL